MKNRYDIKDDEIRILGENPEAKTRKFPLWIIFVLILIAISAVILAVVLTKENKINEIEQPFFEEVELPVISKDPVIEIFGSKVDSLVEGYTETIDTTINDVPLKLLIPHNAKASLHIGRPPIEDTSVVYIAQAADIRADNKKILGAFVLKGEPLAWGLSKKGYCAIIDDEITVGVADNSPLFEEATEKGGYFFRQYPLVNEGTICENEPKNKSVRRAICQRSGQTFIVHSTQTESFHDFAQALVDLGCDNAVYLVGSEAWGWAVNEDGTKEEWGVPRLKTLPKNTSYIVFRK